MEAAKTNTEGQAYYLFLYLIHSFESAALIGLGKLPGPEGECKVELEAASFAIDMLDMIKERTRGNLKEEEEHYLERVLGNLKLNYLTEKERQEKHSKEGGRGEKGEKATTA